MAGDPVEFAKEDEFVLGEGSCPPPRANLENSMSAADQNNYRMRKYQVS